MWIYKKHVKTKNKWTDEGQFLISSIGKRQNKAFILLYLHFVQGKKQKKNKKQKKHKKAVTSNKTREDWCS